MTAGWMAVDVRGRALVSRTIGRDGALRIAGASSWDDARSRLRTTVYGRDLAADADRAAARRHVRAVTAWQIRVLAGWLPPGGARLARLAAAPLEIADVERHLRHLRGGPAEPPVDLGSLATLGPRLGRTTSATEVRRVLARSIWGDPGSDDPVVIGLAMRARLAVRGARVSRRTLVWSRAAMAVLVARERFAFDRVVPEEVAHDAERLLPRGCRAADSPTAFVTRLAPEDRWPFESVTDGSDLWRAELAVIERVERDSAEHVRTSRASVDVTASLFALSVIDAWRVAAAIEAAADGAVGPGTEVLGAVAA